MVYVLKANLIRYGIFLLVPLFHTLVPIYAMAYRYALRLHFDMTNRRSEWDLSSFYTKWTFSVANNMLSILTDEKVLYYGTLRRYKLNNTV